MHGLYKELVCVCLRWMFADVENHNALEVEDLNSRPELNVSEWFGAERFKAIFSLMQIVSDNYGIRPLCRALLWTCYGLFINRFYKGKLQKQGSIQRKALKSAINVLNRSSYS